MNAKRTNGSFFLVAFGVVLLCSSNAAAEVSTCLDLEVDDPEQAEGFAKLVKAEVATHPSHTVVDENCETHLKVQLFSVAGSRQITVRVNQEVPVRYTIQSKNMLASKLREAISLALGNDPVFLAKDITRYSAVQRAVHGVSVKGVNIFRLELFEEGVRTGQGPAFAPGAAFSMSRGAGHWQVFARLMGMGRPGERENGKPFLKVAVGADAGLVFEKSVLASASWYVGLGLSVRYMRFEGKTVDQDGGIIRDKIDTFMPLVFSRLGVRMFRMSDFDFDIFITGYLPFTGTKDERTLLFQENDEAGRYTPSIQMGVGVGF